MACGRYGVAIFFAIFISVGQRSSRIVSFLVGALLGGPYFGSRCKKVQFRSLVEIVAFWKWWLSFEKMIICLRPSGPYGPFWCPYCSHRRWPSIGSTIRLPNWRQSANLGPECSQNQWKSEVFVFYVFLTWGWNFWILQGEQEFTSRKVSLLGRIRTGSL